LAGTPLSSFPTPAEKPVAVLGADAEGGRGGPQASRAGRARGESACQTAPPFFPTPPDLLTRTT